MKPKRSLYEPPISGGPFPTRAWSPTVQLAPGVRGRAFKKEGDIYIVLISAEHEGSGDLGRFLDQLSTHCVVVSVTEPHLENMLIRRGFIKKMLSNGEDEWRRPAIRSHLYRKEQ